MRAVFLCPKRDNFACLHTRQDQNELHLKRWFFFAKIVIFCKSIEGPLREALFKRLHNHIRSAEGYDKPDTIDALKDNIREAIGEI